jgi:uncharacterized membrane protein
VVTVVAAAKPTATRGPDRRLGPSARRLWLTAHVAVSVAWIGIEAALLALGVVGLTTSDPAVLRAAYVALGRLGDIFILPFSAATLVTGTVLGVRTKWGLVRYHWVRAKLMITVALTAGSNLAVNRRLQSLAGQALHGAVDARAMPHVVAPLAVGTVLLVTATVLSMYKPWGRTAYGLSR